MGAEQRSFLSRLRGRGGGVEATSLSVTPPPTSEPSPDEALDNFLKRGSPGEVFSFEEPNAPIDTNKTIIKPYLPKGVFEEGW